MRCRGECCGSNFVSYPSYFITLSIPLDSQHYTKGIHTYYYSSEYVTMADIKTENRKEREGAMSHSEFIRHMDGYSFFFFF